MLRGNQIAPQKASFFGDPALPAALEENSLDSWDFCPKGKEKKKHNYGREKRLLRGAGRG